MNESKQIETRGGYVKPNKLCRVSSLEKDCKLDNIKDYVKKSIWKTYHDHQRRKKHEKMQQVLIKSDKPNPDRQLV